MATLPAPAQFQIQEDVLLQAGLHHSRANSLEFCFPKCWTPAVSSDFSWCRGYSVLPKTKHYAWADLLWRSRCSTKPKMPPITQALWVSFRAEFEVCSFTEMFKYLQQRQNRNRDKKIKMPPSLLSVLQYFSHPNKMSGAHSLHVIWQVKKQTGAVSTERNILHLDKTISHKRWISETVSEEMFLSSYWKKKKIRGGNCLATNKGNRIVWF